MNGSQKQTTAKTFCGKVYYHTSTKNLYKYVHES